MSIEMLSNLSLLTLSEIPKIGRRTVNFINNNCSAIPVEPFDYLELIQEAKKSKARIKVPKIEDVREAMYRAENIYNKCLKEKIQIVGVNESIFPGTLKSISDRPILLYVKGNLEVLSLTPTVAIIGTREPSSFGYAFGKRLAQVLTECGFVVVSGLALGCDTSAHVGCLEAKGKTVAVLAHGLDNVYPKENKALADRILNSSGCLISEYALGVRARSNYFVDRDRLQSGLSNAVIVIETAIEGGTMHTVKFCIEQERVLACLSHPQKHLVNNKKAEGNQLLIREKGAIPIFEKDSIDSFVELIEKKIRTPNSNKFKGSNSLETQAKQLTLGLD